MNGNEKSKLTSTISVQQTCVEIKNLSSRRSRIEHPASGVAFPPCGSTSPVHRRRPGRRGGTVRSTSVPLHPRSPHPRATYPAGGAAPPPSRRPRFPQPPPPPPPPTTFQSAAASDAADDEDGRRPAGPEPRRGVRPGLRPGPPGGRDGEARGRQERPRARRLGPPPAARRGRLRPAADVLPPAGGDDPGERPRDAPGHPSRKYARTLPQPAGVRGRDGVVLASPGGEAGAAAAGPEAHALPGDGGVGHTEEGLWRACSKRNMSCGRGVCVWLCLKI